MPSTFEILIVIVMFVVIILLALMMYLHDRRWASVVLLLGQVDHSKPTLDVLELVGRLTPPEVTNGVLQLASGIVALLPAGDAKNLLVTGEDIFKKITDGKPNDDSAVGATEAASQQIQKLTTALQGVPGNTKVSIQLETPDASQSASSTQSTETASIDLPGSHG